MSEVGGEDIERLASRVAMLASDDGEADNAGRAVGQLARRLGLSGGDLKAIVLAGAGKAYRPGSAPGLLKLEHEVDGLRRALREAQEAARTAQQDRDALVAENGAMRVAMYRQRAGTRLWRLVLGLAVLGAVLVGAGAMLLTPEAGPGLGFGSAPVPQIVTVPGMRAEGVTAAARVARVRSGGTAVYREADRDSPVLERLPVGYQVLVRSLSPSAQWARVEVDGRSGYIPAIELRLD